MRSKPFGVDGPEAPRRHFQVSVVYPFVSRERPIVQAPSPAQAAVDAVLQGLVPVSLSRGEPPVFWFPEFPQICGEHVRWPELLEVSEGPDGSTAVSLGWGGADNAMTLTLNVVEVAPTSTSP